MTIQSEGLAATPVEWTLRGTRLLRRLWPALVVLVLAAVVVGNLRGSRAAGTPVRLAEMVRGSLSVEILATGSIEPAQRLEVRWPYATGRVAAVLVEPGQRVAAGQPLLRLAPALLEEASHRELSSYLAARDRLTALVRGSRETDAAQLELALERSRRELAHQETRQEQVEELHRSGLISKMERDAVGYQVDTAGLAVREAELALEAFHHALGAGEVRALEEEVEGLRLAAERSRRAAEQVVLTAPADATVLEAAVRPGELLAEGQLAFLLADMRGFRVSLLVDELEVRRLRPGQTVRVDSGYFDAEGVEGVVDRVVPIVRDRRGVPSVEVLVAVVAPEGWEPPAGLGIEARIRVDRADGVVTVPLEAVVERNGRNGVFVAADGQARFQVVDLGLRNESRVEIVSGAAPGQTVVVAGHVFLQDGDAVVAVEDSSSGSLKVEFFQ